MSEAPDEGGERARAARPLCLHLALLPPGRCRPEVDSLRDRARRRRLHPLFTHELPREDTAKVAAGWQLCLDELEIALNGDPPREFPDGPLG